jgi:hypothetical protein
MSGWWIKKRGMNIPDATDDSSVAGDASDKPQRHRLRWSFSLATLFWAITTVILTLVVCILARQKQIATNEVARLQELFYEDSTICFDYGRIALFRVHDEIYALRMTATKLNDGQRIDYEWMQLKSPLSSIANDFVEWDDAFIHQPEDSRGGSFLNEADNVTHMSCGPLMVPWSDGGTCGWLYFSDTRQNGSYRNVRFEVYRAQLDEIRQRESLDKRLWKPVRLDR